MIRYDTIEEFNMDSEAECDQLNLAHVARKKEETSANGRMTKFRLPPSNQLNVHLNPMLPYRYSYKASCAIPG